MYLKYFQLILIILLFFNNIFSADLEFGKITDIHTHIDEKNENKIIFTLTLEQAYAADHQNVQNSILASFTEKSIVTETKKGSFIIHLDAIGKFKYKMPKNINNYFLDAISPTETNGSYIDPNIQQTNKQTKNKLLGRLVSSKKKVKQKTEVLFILKITSIK